jgi:hypothetical protein
MEATASSPLFETRIATESISLDEKLTAFVELESLHRPHGEVP